VKTTYLPACFLCFVLFTAKTFAQSPVITTYAGPPLPSDGALALGSAIDGPQAVISDGQSGFYVSSENRVYHVRGNGTILVMAGSGSSGFSGDNGPAPAAQLNGAWGLALDQAGNLYIADTKNNRIRKVDPAGIISTVAGTGGTGFSGDGGPATAAQFAAPTGLAFDRLGNLFVADTANSRIRKINLGGVISTVAGNGEWRFAGEGGPATAASFYLPLGLATDANNNLFVADCGNSRVRKIDPAGTITTVAGDGNPNVFENDVPAISTGIADVTGVTVDLAGNLLIASPGSGLVRRVDSNGRISNVAGSFAGTGFSGDGGPATTARLSGPIGVAVDATGNILFTDSYNNRVRKVTSLSGIISTVAGTGIVGSSGDGGSATAARLASPFGVAVDTAGNLYIADNAGNEAPFGGLRIVGDTNDNRVRKVTPDGAISTIAGNGTFGLSGDGGPATAAQLAGPTGVAVDNAGNLFIADFDNGRVRKVTPAGAISTIAGPVLSDPLDRPLSVAVDGDGNIFYAVSYRNQIRKITPQGTVSIVAGGNTGGFGGDGGSALAAKLNIPMGLAIDAAGNLFIADTDNNRVRKVTPQGTISTVAGNGSDGFGGGFPNDTGSGDGGPATSAQLVPLAVAVDRYGNLFITDYHNSRIRKVTPTGTISTVAGNSISGTGGPGLGQLLFSYPNPPYDIGGFSGDDGPATGAQLNHPTGLAVDANGDLFIADNQNSRIRKVTFARSFTLPNLGATSLTTSGSAVTASVGYGRILPAAGKTTPSGLAIFGYRVNGVLVSETGVPAVSPINAGRIYAEVQGAVNTGVAIANPNNAAANINVFFTDAAGDDLGAGSFVIPAKTQLVKFLDQSPYNRPGPFQGTMSFMSDVPVGVIALRGLTNERGDFLMSTLPVVDTTSTTGSVTQMIPYYADGGGWTTQIILINPTNTLLTGNLQFLDPAGTATNVTLAGQTGSSFPFSIPPKSSQRLSTAGTTAATTTGSVRVVPSTGAAPTPLLIFSYKPAGITVSEAGVPVTVSTALRMYVESSGAAGLSGSVQSAFAVANMASSAGVVTLELTQLDGTPIPGLSPVSLNLAAYGQASKFLGEFFPSLPDPFKGVLRITTSSTGMSLVGLRARYNERGDFLITTTPAVIENSPSTSDERLFPHLVDGAGFTTQFILFSGSAGQSTSGSLRLFDPAGQPLDIVLK
jgi:sugar lactone lactonase YvrE